MSHLGNDFCEGKDMEGRIVLCRKLGKELPGLLKPPFPGDLGRQIFENVSMEAWQMWQEMQIKVINEYRLNLGSSSDYNALLEQMMLFLNLKDGVAAEVENPNRGKN